MNLVNYQSYYKLDSDIPQLSAKKIIITPLSSETAYQSANI